VVVEYKENNNRTKKKQKKKYNGNAMSIQTNVYAQCYISAKLDPSYQFISSAKRMNITLSKLSV